MSNLQNYIPLVEFLGKALGEHCEVVLHDLAAPEKSIIAIANGHISGRETGGPATDFILKKLKQKGEQTPFIANYQGRSKNGSICRSSSYFIKHGTKIIGVLCINIDLSAYQNMRQQIDTLLGELPFFNDTPQEIASPKEDKENNSVLENFHGTIDGVISTMIKKRLQNYPVEASRLCYEERLKLVSVLNADGLFLLRGGLTALAEQLNISEPTIYRYLSKVKKQSGLAD